MPQAVFEYHYRTEGEQYAFLRIPKVLITDPYFKAVSTDAKLLYGLMLDRMSLSMKNGWLDDEKRVYIYFTLEDVCDALCCKTDKAVKLLAELDSAKGIGLIERVRQGQGRPTRIYVKRFVFQTSEKPKSRHDDHRSQDFGKTEVKSSENQKSRLRKNRGQDFGKTDPNNTEYNNTEYNDTELSIYPSEQMDVIDRCRTSVRENIAYEFLIQQYCAEDIDEIAELIVETLCTQEDFIRIGRKQVYTSLVRERFLHLNNMHIQYVLDCMKDSPSDIRNIKAYLLESLFNAPVTMNNYFQAKVNYDFHGG